ncbi:MAG: leucine-rich repeat domain-containing protein [Candidatus Avoscillospira sp.]
MKKVLKVLIPVVLVLAILGAACWFFFFQRPDLTSGFLQSRASHMVSRGRYERAIRYYSWAWKLEPQESDIPLALADTYVLADNYTKAEYILVRAISGDSGNVDLYTALCKTYVAQDKLLDAVEMLDRITDENVKATLNALRPASPAISPESGYYNEYIEVTVESPEEAVYVTANGEYPSMARDRYEGPITLSGGESTVIAVAVNELGLVSPVMPKGYTIGGVVEEATLSDPTIDAVVREQLGLSITATLMTDDLWSITTLQLPDTVEDLSDLRHFTGLRSLTLQNVSGMDFTVLSQIPSLENLDLSGCTISSHSLEAIGSLTELKSLKLNTCALTDLTSLAALTKLEELDLANNSVTDIGVLSLMLELETVSLANNPISSIAGLATCSQLRSVDISNCSVVSLSSLSGKTQLQTLLAPNNQINDLSDLAGCRSLSVLDVQSNFISDISVLAGLPALTQFDGDHNQITEIPSFVKNAPLQRFSVNYNQISDLSGLSGLMYLNYVEADYNQIEDLMPLADSYNLIQINVWDNPVTEESVAALQERSIIVNYNPNYEPPEPEEEDEETDGEETEQA